MALKYRNKNYQVKEGEDLLQISQNNGVDYQELLGANPGLQWVSPGQNISLPALTGANNAPLYSSTPPSKKAPSWNPHAPINAPDLYARSVGSFQRQAPVGQSTLLGSANERGGTGSAGEVGDKYTAPWGSTYLVTQTDKEGNITAERKMGNYGKRGDKWKTYITQDPNTGVWKKVTTTARGGSSRSNKGGYKEYTGKRRGAAVNRALAGLTNYDGNNTPQLPAPAPILETIMSWRTATG